MLRKEDLEILSYLLDELKKPSNNHGMTISDLTDWDKYNSNVTEEKENEFIRLIGIFSNYNIGSYFDNKGFATLKPTLQTFNADFNKLYEQQIVEEQKREADLEAQEATIKLNKWLIKTKWLPHIVAGISIVISIISFCYNQNEFKNEINELKERIERIENPELESTELVKEDV